MRQHWLRSNGEVSPEPFQTDLESMCTGLRIGQTQRSVERSKMPLCGVIKEVDETRGTVSANVPGLGTFIMEISRPIERHIIYYGTLLVVGRKA